MWRFAGVFVILFFLMLLTNESEMVAQLHSGRVIWDQLEAAETIQDAVVASGSALIGKPYEAYTLESDDPEGLVVNFSSFDCVTFIETSLAMALCLRQNRPGFESFARYLTRIRYRGGRIDGYPSRLHYTSDWAFDNQQKGLLRDITQEIGGILSEKDIHFMSSNPKFYAKLSRPEFLERIGMVEDRMNHRKHYYLPTEQIAAADALIRSGDLIAITTGVKGLDVSHTGIAVRKDKIHLMHASQRNGKVVISAEPLAELVPTLKNSTGIMVFRPLEPRQ